MSQITWPPQPPSSSALSGWHFRDAWKPTADYVAGDVTTFNGEAWLALSDIAASPLSPLLEPRWTAIAAEQVGAIGAPGTKGPDGVDGPDGAPGLPGDPGPRGPVGDPPSGLHAITWTDILPQNGWFAHPTDKPQYGTTPHGATFLRGTFLHGDATSNVVGHLPASSLPKHQHTSAGSWQRYRVLGADFGAGQLGAIVVDTTDTDVTLDSSFVAGVQGFNEVGSNGTPMGLWIDDPGDFTWVKTAPTVIHVEGTHARKEDHDIPYYMTRFEGRAGRPDATSTRIMPLLFTVPIPFRHGSEIMSILDQHGGPWTYGTASGDGTYFGRMIGPLGTISVDGKGSWPVTLIANTSPPTDPRFSTVDDPVNGEGYFNLGFYWFDCPAFQLDTDHRSNEDRKYVTNGWDIGAMSFDLDLPFMDF